MTRYHIRLNHVPLRRGGGLNDLSYPSAEHITYSYCFTRRRAVLKPVDLRPRLRRLGNTKIQRKHNGRIRFPFETRRRVTPVVVEPTVCLDRTFRKQGRLGEAGDTTYYASHSISGEGWFFSHSFQRKQTRVKLNER